MGCRRWIGLFLFALVWLAGPALPARADAGDEARAAIQVQYDAMNEAAARKDVAGMLSAYTPDFIQVGQHGETVTLAGLRQRLVTGMAGVRGLKGRTVIGRLEFKDNLAVVTMQDHNEITYQVPDMKRPVHIVQDVDAEDTWKYLEGHWLLQHSTVISERTVTDGQPQS